MFSDSGSEFSDLTDSDDERKSEKDIFDDNKYFSNDTLNKSKKGKSVTKTVPHSYMNDVGKTVKSDKNYISLDIQQLNSV